MASSRHDVGASDDFVPGSLYHIELSGRGLLLFRRDDRFFAMRDTCPHQGARLSDGWLQGTTLPCLPGRPITYAREQEIVVCPWHGWEFDGGTGCSIVDPERARVRTYPATVEHSRVIVELE